MQYQQHRPVAALLFALSCGLHVTVADAASFADQPGGPAAEATLLLPTSVGPRKYHPGHYVAMDRDDDGADIVSAVLPGVVGMQKRYMWKELEPTLGQYNFSKIDADLQVVASQGMRLIIFVEDKVFNNKSGKPTPAYLNNYTLPTMSGGWIAERWDPYVIARMNALTTAMAAHFDAHPNVEGLGIQESAVGVSNAVQKANGYTPEKYRDALIAMLTSASQSFQSSRVFWYMNFMPGGRSYLDEVAAAVAPHGVIMGGPDILPDEPALKDRVYPMYAQFRGRMKLFGSMQNSSYAHLRAAGPVPTKYWQMSELFLFARDELHLNYIIWTRLPKPKPADSYAWRDAIPVIGNNIGFNEE